MSITASPAASGETRGSSSGGELDMTVRSGVVGGVVVAALAMACGGGGGGGTKGTIHDYVAAVSCSNCTVTLEAGAPPAATASSAQLRALLAAADQGDTFLRGGTASFDLGEGATRFIVAVEGVDGYWEVLYAGGGAAPALLVTFGQSSPGSFTLRLGAGADGALDYQSYPVTLLDVGTGDVQVNVTWDLDVDVDLHVLDPAGEEIYYGNDLSLSGGALDLDSNPACSLDHTRAENVTWASGTAPSGTYQVLVDYYDACVDGTVHYVVTVNRAGQPPETFPGTFEASDADSGGACFPTSGDALECGRLVTSFQVP
jgi:hypothetical protein